MEINQKNKIIFVSLFVLIETILTILVQTTTGTLLTVVSFGAVVCAFLFSFLTLKKDFDSVLTTIGLFTTVIADIFLVVLHAQFQVIAMFSFSITQICYFTRIYLNHSNKKIKLIHIVVRLSLILIAITATFLVLKDKTDLLSLISLFYYANLLINVIFSLADNKNIIFSIGLICFAMCDLFIGFNIMSSSYIELSEGTFLYFLANPGFNIAWLFYVPSQALIALSNIKKKE